MDLCAVDNAILLVSVTSYLLDSAIQRLTNRGLGPILTRILPIDENCQIWGYKNHVLYKFKRHSLDSYCFSHLTGMGDGSLMGS